MMALKKVLKHLTLATVLQGLNNLRAHGKLCCFDTIHACAKPFVTLPISIEACNTIGNFFF